MRLEVWEQVRSGGRFRYNASMETSILPNVSKMAILRATAIGDFIMALPALRALHASYPQAEITYLGRRWHADFLLERRLPGIQRVVSVPPPLGEDINRGLVIDPQEEEAFFAEMQGEAFDLAVQMHGGGLYSNRFIKKLNARVSIGARTQGAPPLDRWTPYTYYQHEVFRQLEIVGLVGARPQSDELAPSLPVLDSDLQAAQAALEQIDGPFAVLHTGSTDPRRIWPARKFARVGNFLSKELGLKVVLTGTRMDAAQIEQVMAQMQAPCVNLQDQLALSGLTGLLSKAQLVISNDTGPLHLALAVGAPVIGLFWVESVVNFLPLYRQRFLPLIAWDRRCAECGQMVSKYEIDHLPEQGCTHEVSFIASIKTDEVIETAQRLVGKE